MMTLSFKASLEKFEDGLYQYHIKVPESIAEQVEAWREDRRVCCKLNGELIFHCAIMKEKGQYYIMLNAERREKLDLDIRDALEVSLSPSQNDYGIELPREMAEAFSLDPEGSQYFHKLTPGKQRSLLHIIGKLKSFSLRADRSWIILEHLKAQKGKLDFKILNQRFRDAKNMNF